MSGGSRLLELGCPEGPDIFELRCPEGAGTVNYSVRGSGHFELINVDDKEQVEFLVIVVARPLTTQRPKPTLRV